MNAQVDESVEAQILVVSQDSANVTGHLRTHGVTLKKGGIMDYFCLRQYPVSEARQKPIQLRCG